MALKPPLKFGNELSVVLMGYRVACSLENAMKLNTKIQLLPPEVFRLLPSFPLESHSLNIFKRREKKILWTFFFFFLDIKHFQSSWTWRRVSETFHQHVPLATLDSIYLVLFTHWRPSEKVSTAFSFSSSSLVWLSCELEGFLTLSKQQTCQHECFRNLQPVLKLSRGN